MDRHRSRSSWYKILFGYVNGIKVLSGILYNRFVELGYSLEFG